MAKYQTSVQSSAINLMSDFKDIGSNIAAAAAYRQAYPLSREIASGIVNGIAPKMSKVLAYGRDTYTYGLPDGYEVIHGYLPADVEEAVEDDLGFEVDIVSEFLASPDPLVMARDYAQRHWGWSAAEERLVYPPTSSSGGSPVYLHGANIDDKGNLVAQITYHKQNQQVVRSVAIEEQLFDQQALYFHVRWITTGSTGVDPQYWIYKTGTGTHPKLDDSISHAEINKPFLPIIPIREDNVNLGPEYDEDGSVISRPDTELYRTSKQLCRTCDVDFDDLAREVDKNPDVAQIDHTYLIFGIDIRTDKAESQFYLYQFFHNLAGRGIPTGELEIYDASYRIKISYDSCNSTTITGTLDKPTVLIFDNDTSTLTLRRRLDNTTYQEVVVTNLLHTNYIYENHAVQTDLEDSADEDNMNFIIPINYDLSVLDRALVKREALYRESFKIVFNSYERRKLKWYESSWFKFVVVVIAIVLAVWSGGQSLAYLKMLYAAWGVWGVVAYAAAMYALSEAMKVGFAKLSEIVGAEWMIAIAVLVAVASAYLPGFQFEIEGVVVCIDLLAISSGIIQGVNYYTTSALQDLNTEIDEWTETAKEKMKELQELEDALDVDSFLSVYDFLYKPQLFIADEEPEQFYNRTIHAGNIGVATLSQTENYVESKLQLPKSTTFSKKGNKI